MTLGDYKAPLNLIVGDVFRLENGINPCERMVGSNLVYFERQEEPRIRVATLICILTRTFLVFKLETFTKIRSNHNQ